MLQGIEIRFLAPGDYAQWRALWEGYCRFYEATLEEEVSVQTWNRLLDPGVEMFCRVAVEGERLAGFAHCVVHPATWVVAPSCYLEDLYTEPSFRRRGIARALLDDVLGVCRERRYSRLYWHTHRDNATARGLYEQYIAADAFVRYRIGL